MRALAIGSSWDEMRYRLVSLWWLFMDRFHVERFLRAYNSITNLGQTIISFRATNPRHGNGVQRARLPGVLHAFQND
jgi:hypothetical protein